MMDKLLIIEQCIQNDIRAIKDFECHLEILYKLRDEELKRQEQMATFEQEVDEELERDFPV